MISVCMATYNGAKFIKEQLASILKQLKTDDEVVISDDGSTDKTIMIINSFKDSRIHLYNNKGRKGVIGNFESALQKARGDFIFLSDQDDVWYDDKVRICLNLLINNTLVVHNANVIDGDGTIREKSFFKLRGSQPGYWNNIWRNSYLGCCICFRKELLKYLFPIPERIEMHDRWIGLTAQMHGRVFYEKKCLIGYRVHGNNVSNSTGKSKNNLLQMFMIRFWLLYYTALRYLRIC